MSHHRVQVAAVLAGLTIGVTGGTALAASPGTNSGNPADQGNCFGNFANGGSLGYDVSNGGPPAPSGLGQAIGKADHGCR